MVILCLTASLTMEVKKKRRPSFPICELNDVIVKAVRTLGYDKPTAD